MTRFGQAPGSSPAACPATTTANPGTDACRMNDEPLLLVDWGTTNRRIFHIAGPTWRRLDGDGAGAAKTEDFAVEVRAIRRRFGDLPMLLAGMVGSTIGWTVVPYVPAPAGLPEIAAKLHQVEERTWIVPGVAWQADGEADVMRGEELQLLGAAWAGLVPLDAFVCQPGTHCKWAKLSGGVLNAFQTSMTGELFALLRDHSLLAPAIGGEVADMATFRRGVREGARRDLAASLFRIRARGLLGGQTADEGASFASGLVIGADVQARLAELPKQPVHLIAEGALGNLYRAAIDELGGLSAVIASDVALVAGAAAIWSQKS